MLNIFSAQFIVPIEIVINKIRQALFLYKWISQKWLHLGITNGKRKAEQIFNSRFFKFWTTGTTVEELYVSTEMR